MGDSSDRGRGMNTERWQASCSPGFWKSGPCNAPPRSTPTAREEGRERVCAAALRLGALAALGGRLPEKTLIVLGQRGFQRPRCLIRATETLGAPDRLAKARPGRPGGFRVCPGASPAPSETASDAQPGGACGFQGRRPE